MRTRGSNFWVKHDSPGYPRRRRGSLCPHPLFTHVSSNLSVSWGPANGTGLVSVEFSFAGEAAHGAGAPWRGRSALDAVEILNIAWNFRREHLRPVQNRGLLPRASTAHFYRGLLLRASTTGLSRRFVFGHKLADILN